MADNIAISVKNVSKDFKLPHERVDSVKSLFVRPLRRGGSSVQHALDDVSFDIKKGEFFGIVGRNGSGKSTLLKIIAGIYQPTKGSVTVDGRLVPFIELGVGFNPELSGRENVYLNGALMGFSQKEIKSKYDSIVEFAELAQFMDQKLKNYSSGMQVRLAFSVATILAQSDILLIDEVLAVGDADFQKKCFDYFKKLKREKKTVVFVSHDMDSVREYCDRAVLINDSKVLYSGTADRIAKEYNRLFMPKPEVVEEVHTDTQSDKWGVGGVDIINPKSKKPHYTNKDKAIEISYTVKADGYSGIIIPGFTIKDEQGRSVCGTNSKVLKKRQSLFKLDNNQLRMTWTIPNIFNQGVYRVEPAVINGSGKETLQWWNNAFVFSVENEHSVPVHLISPAIELDVK